MSLRASGSRENAKEVILPLDVFSQNLTPVWIISAPHWSKYFDICVSRLALFLPVSGRRGPL